ncbi:MAG: class I SAM-dependent methyltransferase [Candidatus Bathyarchaeota archaeon]|nr:class I SAM-dependent methyltransferase [Candidatus Bathyarchaeota archaeon]MDH5732708.1 class I SAM-dependent methyltransferase [Candidatus Bathyarchaeota archaeon]
MKLSRKPMKKLFFDDCVFHVLEDVYEPAEDTFLLAENLRLNKDEFVLDMGTGCGILAILAARRAREVIATDINPYAVYCAKINAKLNGVERKMNILRGDVFQPIREGKQFDLVLFNTPYLPSEEEDQKPWIEKAWAGGFDGRGLIDRFLLDAPEYLEMDGRILLVQSTLSDVDKTLKTFRKVGLKAKITAREKVAFETIVVIEAEVF